nr:hypothetical protein [Tanacetum cinerariifolium]
MTIFKQTVNLEKESYHKLFDIVKHYQKEVNEICAEKIAKNTNPLALATAQQYLDTYYQAPKPHRSYAPLAKTSPSTRSHAATRHKGKEIVKPITPSSEPASEEGSDLEQAQRDKEMQKNLALIAKYFKKIYKPTNNNFRTFSNSRNKNVDNSPRYVSRRRYSVSIARNLGTLLRSAENQKGQKITLIISKRCCCANKLRKQPESINDTPIVEKDDINVIPDSSNMCDNDNQADQNANECDDEHVVLANLIANLKLDTDENKKIQKQLKKANTSLSYEPEECKSSLEEERVEVLGKQTGYTIQSVQHNPGPGHPNTFYYSESDESDDDEPSKMNEDQKSIHHLSGSLTPFSNPIVESLSLLPTPFEDIDSLIDPLPPADRSDLYHEEFADELAHIIPPSEYDYFYFDLETDPREFTSVVEKNIFDLSSTKDSTSIELNDALLLSDCDSSLSKFFSRLTF